MKSCHHLFLLCTCWKQLISGIWVSADRTAQGSRRASWLVSKPFMQIQLPGFIFRSLKTGPQTPVQHDKPLRSSHFSTKTIRQCVDSALPPLLTFCCGCGSQAGPFYWLLELCMLQVVIHALTHIAHYITVVWEVEFPGVALIKVSPLIIWNLLLNSLWM